MVSDGLVTNSDTVVITTGERYFRNNTTDIVTDIGTGLQWQDNESIMKPWLTQEYYDTEYYENTAGDTAQKYCHTIALDGGGWRLPTHIELNVIVDTNYSDPSIHPVFINTVSGFYWSSDSTWYESSDAWGVYFTNGYISINDKANTNYVRCMRAVQ